MKNHILCLLLALALLACFCACKREEEPPVGGEPPSPDTAESTDEGNEQYLSLSFRYGREGERGKGFDTANNTVLDGILSYRHDYSGILDTLFYELSTAKAELIAAESPDMTGFALSGGTLTAPADNFTYAITFTTSEGTYSILTDTLALETYPENSHISSLKVLITSFRTLTEQHLAAATA